MSASPPTIFFLALGLFAFSGVPGLVFPSVPRIGHGLSVFMTSLGAVLGVTSAVSCFFPGYCQGVGGFNLEWLAFFWDPFSCFFLVSFFLIAGLGSIYGWEYWKQEDHPRNARKLRVFYGLMTAGMSLVVVSRHAFLFLLSWEVMALSAFFLVVTEDEKRETREAGWVYFVATHVSTLLLFGFFAFYGHLRGNALLSPFVPGEISPAHANFLFLVALVAFGLKAGLYPFHVWLPSAHANAPSHVSALLSGVLLKVGVYGLMRVCWLFPEPPVWWGSTLVVLGVVSSVLGVAFALGQHDIKRLLAYHSIENIGIIFLGMGLALLGRSGGVDAWIWWGLGGALLHTWNHGFFKAMLFFGAGSVIRAVHTRQIDEMGGLSKTMPWTGFGFLAGAVAICGLPPLNGFISELLIYMGYFKALGSGVFNPVWVVSIPALALTGGLALACFTKVYGAVFLGEARTVSARQAKEAGWTMLFPVFFLFAACLWIGLFPQTVLTYLTMATQSWAPSLLLRPSPVPGGIPWGVFTVLGAAILILCALGQGWLRRGRGDFPVPEKVATWGCGYLRPTVWMQYSASSFAQILVEFFRWFLFPSEKGRKDAGYFPGRQDFSTHVPETVLDHLVLPIARGSQWLLGWFRYLQMGYLQLYVFYIFLTLLFLILWSR